MLNDPMIGYYLIMALVANGFVLLMIADRLGKRRQSQRKG